MTHVLVPEEMPLAWYLAAEEALALHAKEDMFFGWIVRPTVIFGRHQQWENELDMDYCKRNDVRVVQRKSGGGCVYADEGNLMLSFITVDTHSATVFPSMLQRVADVLTECGLEAVCTEHNDILADGKKISGNACYALPTATIVHGTILYDVNMDRLQHAITPPVEKLEKHSVQSVRQRVCNIKALLNDDISDIYMLRERFERSFCTKTRHLTLTEQQAIADLLQSYNQLN